MGGGGGCVCVCVCVCIGSAYAGYWAVLAFDEDDVGGDEFGLDADDDDDWEEGKDGNGGSFARADERVFGSSNAWNVSDDGWMDDRKIKDSDSL